jgi:hypothetical protein
MNTARVPSHAPVAATPARISKAQVVDAVDAVLRLGTERELSSDFPVLLATLQGVSLDATPAGALVRTGKTKAESLTRAVRRTEATLLASQLAFRRGCLDGLEDMSSLRFDHVHAQASHYDALRAFFEGTVAS